MMGWATCFENEETDLTICFVKPLPRVLRIFFPRGFIGSDLPRVVKVNYLGAPVGDALDMSSPALERGFLLRRIGDTVLGSSDTHLCYGGVVQHGFDPISTWLIKHKRLARPRYRPAPYKQSLVLPPHFDSNQLSSPECLPRTIPRSI